MKLLVRSFWMGTVGSADPAHICKLQSNLDFEDKLDSTDPCFQLIQSFVDRPKTSL